MDEIEKLKRELEAARETVRLRDQDIVRLQTMVETRERLLKESHPLCSIPAREGSACTACAGSGLLDDYKGTPCPTCSGTGKSAWEDPTKPEVFLASTAEKVAEARKALRALYAEVPIGVAKAVNAEVEAAFKAMEQLASSGCRPEVILFARAMERELRANDHKSGWKDEDVVHLLSRISDETRELKRVIGEGRSLNTILSEAADVANFCMMVTDVVGALLPVPIPGVDQ